MQHCKDITIKTNYQSKWLKRLFRQLKVCCGGRSVCILSKEEIHQAVAVGTTGPFGSPYR